MLNINDKLEIRLNNFSYPLRYELRSKLSIDLYKKIIKNISAKLFFQIYLQLPKSYIRD